MVITAQCPKQYLFRLCKLYSSYIFFSHIFLFPIAPNKHLHNDVGEYPLDS